MELSQHTIYFILSPPAAVSSILIGLLAWSQRESRGAKAFTAFMVLVTGWNITYFFELVTPTPEQTLLWARIGYLFITTCPVALFLFVIQFFGKDQWMRRGLILVMLALPIITNFLVWHPTYYRLIWQEYAFIPVEPGYLPIQIVEYGGWFWVSASYTYILTTISILLMIRYVFVSSTLFRQQAMWIFIASLFPLIFNLVYIFKLIPGFTKDFTPITFSFSGILIALAIFRYKLFDLSPIGREVIIEEIEDGFINIDRLERIVDMNPAAAKIFQVKIKDLIGKQIQALLPNWNTLLPQNTTDNMENTLILEHGEKKSHYDLKITTHQDGHRKDFGTIILLRDITERVLLLQEVQQLAIYDSLTNVFNRRHFFQIAEKLVAQSIRYHRPVSILMLDLDHFKKVNDQYGHTVGDRVLQHFASQCIQNIRSSDIIARFGGEEFIILLPETNERNALMMAERLRQQVAETPTRWDAQSIQITVSIGLACFKPSASPVTLDTLIEQADQALYAAKEKGRNQTVSAAESLK
jgi:diguanylate cyclase (GGDEF)-like protein